MKVCRIPYFLQLLILIPFLSSAQRGFENHYNSGAPVYTDTGESGKIQHKFILSFNAGPNFPTADYGSNTGDFTNYDFNGPEGYVYGYSNNGWHYDINGIYLFSQRIGLALKLGLDENNFYNNGNPANKVFTYLTGVHISVNQTESKFNFSFLALIGLIAANISAVNNAGNSSSVGSINTDVVPGNGIGFGFYGGIEFTFKVYQRLYFNISGGMLGSPVNFPNATTTTTNYSFNPYPNGTFTTSESNSDMKMNLGILEANLGISFHI